MCRLASCNFLALLRLYFIKLKTCKNYFTTVLKMALSIRSTFHFNGFKLPIFFHIYSSTIFSWISTLLANISQQLLIFLWLKHCKHVWIYSWLSFQQLTPYLSCERWLNSEEWWIPFIFFAFFGFIKEHERWGGCQGFAFFFWHKSRCNTWQWRIQRGGVTGAPLVT